MSKKKITTQDLAEYLGNRERRNEIVEIRYVDELLDLDKEK